MANHLISLPSKARQKQGDFPPSALPDFIGNIPFSDSRPGQNRLFLLRATTPHLARASHVAQITFLTCHPHYPGRPEREFAPVSYPLCIGLPRLLGGSASTTFLSEPVQGSLALRPARLLQPYRLTSVPRASAGRSPCPSAWVTTGMNRQFPGRDSHPLLT